MSGTGTASPPISAGFSCIPTSIPPTSTFASNGSAGQDGYNDYAVDGGYQWIGDGTNVVSVLGIFDHEEQNLASSFATGAASQPEIR